MKKIIIMLVFVLASKNLSAQQLPFSCHTFDVLQHEANFNRNIETATYDSKTPYVINAFFTLVNNSNPSIPTDPIGVNNITGNNILDTPEQREAAFLDCIKMLNIAFNQYNIFFKYEGYQVVIDESINNNPNLGFTLINDWNVFTPYKKPNAMNLYFINKSGGSFDAIPSAILGGTESVFPINFLSFHYFLEFSLIHQVGHNLSLYHTYETGSHYTGTPLEPITACERVTRDPLNPLYYADIAGDEVADTAAQTLTGTPDFLPNCGDYIFNPNYQNCYNEPYEDIQIGNYMGANVWTGCWHLTPGQGARMRKFIRFNTSDYSTTTINSVRNNVASLYEPYSYNTYSGDVISVHDNGDVISVHDNGDGTANVCRTIQVQHRFQPGFTYSFPENNSPDPLTATTNDTPTVRLHVFDYPVTIEQLAPGQTNLMTNTGLAHISCTRGLICNDELYKKGTIISAETLTSTNVSIQELNEIQVRNPDLYNSLMSHYYYNLKKETESGVKTEQVFYKE
jgi:hypothetical protein